MVLYLLRHGDSQTDPAIPDSERALTSEGLASIERVARALKSFNLQYDVMYSSPLLRARQTAEIALRMLEAKPAVTLTDHLKVGADFQKLFDLLNGHSPDARILLVGHEPYFSQLVSTLLVGTLEAKVDVRKASLCCLDVAHPVRPGQGTLKWLLTPQLVDLIH